MSRAWQNESQVGHFYRLRGKKQAICPLFEGIRSGCLSLHISREYLHLLLNIQPWGRLRGEGTSPSSICGLLERSVVGIEFRSASVYGCCGLLNSGLVSRVSSIFPRYMTYTLSLMTFTRERSCVIKRRESPSLFFRSISNWMICACTDTSSADTTSSQMINLGEIPMDLAIAIRWRWPPEKV